MFTPTSNINLEDLWGSLGTVYNDLDDDSKAVIEAFWEAMFNGVAGMYYDLYQNYLAKFFEFNQGYLEHSYQDLDIIFTGDDKNVDDILFSPPSGLALSNTPVADGSMYAYKITSVDSNSGETLASTPVVLISGAANLTSNPNVLTWTATSGVASYNVYGRDLNQFLYIGNTTSTTFSDNGSVTPVGGVPTEATAIQGYIYPFTDGLFYLSMPTLSGYSTDQVLTEGTDYEIEALTKLKFLKGLGTGANNIQYKTVDTTLQKGEKFLNRQSICLLPTLGSIYFPGFGVDYPDEIISAGAYSPFISGWNDMTYFNQRLYYGQHLSNLMYALSVVTRREPTINNVKHGLELILGFPFSYKPGTVASIEEDAVYKYVTITTSGLTETVTYEVPVATHLAVASGDTVSQFETLISGAFVDDYITDFATVSGVSLQCGEVKEFDVFTQTYSGSKHGFRVIDNLIDDITKVKQSDSYTVNFNELSSTG